MLHRQRTPPRRMGSWASRRPQPGLAGLVIWLEQWVQELKFKWKITYLIPDFAEENGPAEARGETRVGHRACPSSWPEPLSLQCTPQPCPGCIAVQVNGAPWRCARQQLLVLCGCSHRPSLSEPSTTTCCPQRGLSHPVIQGSQVSALQTPLLWMPFGSPQASASLSGKEQIGNALGFGVLRSMGSQRDGTERPN